MRPGAKAAGVGAAFAAPAGSRGFSPASLGAVCRFCPGVSGAKNGSLLLALSVLCRGQMIDHPCSFVCTIGAAARNCAIRRKGKLRHTIRRAFARGECAGKRDRVCCAAAARRRSCRSAAAHSEPASGRAAGAGRAAASVAFARMVGGMCQTDGRGAAFF